MSTTTPPLLTADEFLHHPAAAGRSELVRGEIRPMTPASGEHGLIAGTIFGLLWTHVRQHGLGRCFTEATGFRLPIPGRSDDTVRAPDAAFVRADRLPSGEAMRHFLLLAPDLAVEVLSPSDRATELQGKLDDYFAAGTPLIWVVDPARWTVHVHTAGAPLRRLRADDVLDGAPVLPDFHCDVAALFEGLAPPAPRATPPAAR